MIVGFPAPVLVLFLCRVLSISLCRILYVHGQRLFGHDMATDTTPGPQLSGGPYCHAQHGRDSSLDSCGLGRNGRGQHNCESRHARVRRVRAGP
jgi:hypothetical protein